MNQCSKIKQEIGKAEARVHGVRQMIDSIDRIGATDLTTAKWTAEQISAETERRILGVVMHELEVIRGEFGLHAQGERIVTEIDCAAFSQKELEAAMGDHQVGKKEEPSGFPWGGLLILWSAIITGFAIGIALEKSGWLP